MKQINNKILWSSTGNYIQYLIINYNEKQTEKYTCNETESLCSILETNTTL